MDRVNLHIVMPTNRREYIGSISQSIYDAEPHNLYITLHLIYQPDSTHNLAIGIDKINSCIDYLKDGWLWVLSDDTKINPKIFRRFEEVITANPSIECVVFSNLRQDPYPRVLHASKHSVLPGMIDGSQFIMKRSLMGNLRYDYSTHIESLDGFLAQYIYDRNREKFIFVDEPLTSFNEYQWKQDEYS